MRCVINTIVHQVLRRRMPQGSKARLKSLKNAFAGEAPAEASEKKLTAQQRQICVGDRVGGLPPIPSTRRRLYGPLNPVYLPVY